MVPRTRGPLLTLAAVLLLTVLLLVVNARIGGQVAPQSAAYPAPAPTSSAPPTTEAAPPPPTPPPAPVQAVFTGATGGKEATVAVAVNGAQAAAYLCDGQSLETWLQGSVTGDQITLTGKNGAGLTGSFSGGSMSGTVTTNTGQTFPFSAAQAAPPAGIYQSRVTLDGLATRVGWVVLPDGTQVGIANAGGTRSPAPDLELGTGTFTLDGDQYTAAPVDGADIVVGQ